MNILERIEKKKAHKIALKEELKIRESNKLESIKAWAIETFGVCESVETFLNECFFVTLKENLGVVYAEIRGEVFIEDYIHGKYIEIAKVNDPDLLEKVADYFSKD